MVRLNNVLQVNPDASERLVTSFEYILQDIQLLSRINIDILYAIVEKASSYRNMFQSISIGTLPLLTQISTVTSHFSEYEETLQSIPFQIKFKRFSIQELFHAFEQWLAVWFDYLAASMSEQELTEFSSYIFIQLSSQLLVLKLSSYTIISSLHVSESIVYEEEPTPTTLLQIFRSVYAVQPVSPDPVELFCCSCTCLISSLQPNPYLLDKLSHYFKVSIQKELDAFIIELESERAVVEKELAELDDTVEDGDDDEKEASEEEILALGAEVPAMLTVNEGEVSSTSPVIDIVDAPPSSATLVNAAKERDAPATVVPAVADDTPLTPAVDAVDIELPVDVIDPPAEDPSAPAELTGIDAVPAEISSEPNASVTTTDEEPVFPAGVDAVRMSLSETLKLELQQSVEGEGADGYSARVYQAIRDRVLSEYEEDDEAVDEDAFNISLERDPAVVAAWDYSPVQSPNANTNDYQLRKRRVSEAAFAIEVALSTHAFEMPEDLVPSTESLAETLQEPVDAGLEDELLIPEGVEPMGNAVDEESHEEFRATIVPLASSEPEPQRVIEHHPMEDTMQVQASSAPVKPVAATGLAAWKELRDKGVLPKALQKPVETVTPAASSLREEVIGRLIIARRKVEDRNQAELEEKMVKQRATCRQIAAMFSKPTPPLVTVPLPEVNVAQEGSPQPVVVPTAPSAPQTTVPSVRDLRNASNVDPEAVVVAIECVEAPVKPVEKPISIWSRPIVKSGSNLKTLGEVLAQPKATAAPEMIQPTARDDIALNSPVSNLSRQVRLGAQDDIVKSNGKKAPVPVTRPSPAVEAASAPEIPKPANAKFEIRFDATKDAKTLEQKREAKMEILRRKSQEEEVLRHQKARSKSAGVFRKKSAEGADVMEERSVVSIASRRQSDVSVISDADTARSARSGVRARAPPPLSVDAGGSPVEKGYLYFHEIKTKGKDALDTASVASEPRREVPSLHLSPRPIVTEAILEEPPSERAPSPVASVSSKRRAVSVSRQRSIGGSTKLSNQQQVKNALVHICMAGVHLQGPRNEALLMMEHYSQGAALLHENDPEPVAVAQFIIMLFHSKTLAFRALYAVHPITGELLKIYGKGPKVLQESCVEEYFKFESSSRCFSKLSSKTITATTDAVSVDTLKLLRK